MGARGPKPGSGAISAWIVAALQAGTKTRAELLMGSGYTARQLDYALKFIRNGMKPLGIEQKKVADVPPADAPTDPMAPVAPAAPATPQ